MSLEIQKTSKKMFQVSFSIKFLQVSSYTPLKTGYKIKRMHTLSQSSICECLYLCCMKQSTAFECKHPVLSLGFDGMFVQDTQTQQYHSTKNYKQKKLRSFFFNKISRMIRHTIFLLAQYN